MTPRPRRPLSEQLPGQARALADPTRYAIFRYLDDALGPVGVAELTTHFGFNHNAIRQHLAKLRDAGLVTEEIGAPTGPGRPALRFRPTPGAAERWDGADPYERLATMLIGLVRGDGTPFEVGYHVGQDLARDHGVHVDAVEIIEAVARRLGFEPRRETRPSGVEIILGRCPFATAATLAPDLVCELHRGLAAGIAASAAGDVTVTGLVVKAATRAGCRLQIELGHADHR